ncbi:MAG: hypothetical protein H7840_12325 [Alphaproteobacteria bacterium]
MPSTHPPYWGREDYYGRALFERADFERLAGVLRGLRGRFLMSLNDVPEVRRIFDGFTFQQVETSYQVSRETSGRGRVNELLISDGKGVNNDGTRWRGGRCLKPAAALQFFAPKPCGANSKTKWRATT